MVTRRVTARDVAERVGCSVASVSLVVNGQHQGRISQDLYLRISAVVAELHYQTNVGARTLATGTRSSVALVCPEIRNTFFGELFHGSLEALAGRYGVDVIVGSRGDDYDLETVRAAQARDIAGLILVNPTAAVLDGFVPTCETVLVDSPASSHELPGIDINLELAGQQLAEHLVALGHRTIGYIDLVRDKDTYRDRRSALVMALNRLGATLTSSTTITAADSTLDAAQSAFAAVWCDWKAAGVTAVVCAQDVFAYGVVAASRQLGIGIPRDLSIASFDDLPISRLLDPALTTVRFDPSEIGRRAGLMLLGLLDGEKPHSQVFDTTLSVRESTGRAALLVS
jgi:LacI family transcriptional regulator